MCGNLWMSEDGLRIFTRCGNVFRASESQAQDMTYGGSLSQTPFVQSVAHSNGLRKVLAIPANSYYETTDSDTNVHVYGYDYLSYEKSIALPSFYVNDTSYPGHGKFIFFNNSGTRFYVVQEADASSGMLYDYGIVTFSSVSALPEARTENLYFAQFANGAGFVSELTLTNPSATETATGEVSFFNDAGSRLSFSLNEQAPAEITSVTIPPRGSITLSTDGTSSPVSGSARVEASVRLGGVIRFKYPGLGIGGVGTSSPVAGFVTPVTRNALQGRSMGIAIASVGSEASVALVLRNKNGEIIPEGQSTILLPANGHLARFLQELFPDANTDEFEGTLTAIAADAVFITGAVFELGLNPGEFTTMPITPLN